jgi:hypothetical protein
MLLQLLSANYYPGNPNAACPEIRLAPANTCPRPQAVSGTPYYPRGICLSALRLSRLGRPGEFSMLRCFRVRRPESFLMSFENCLVEISVEGRHINIFDFGKTGLSRPSWGTSGRASRHGSLSGAFARRLGEPAPGLWRGASRTTRTTDFRSYWHLR